MGGEVMNIDHSTRGLCTNGQTKKRRSLLLVSGAAGSNEEPAEMVLATEATDRARERIAGAERVLGLGDSSGSTAPAPPPQR
jgi:hypothetical protein